MEIIYIFNIHINNKLYNRKTNWIYSSKRILKILLNRLEVQDISKRELLTGLTTNFKDYEDSVQHECAKLCKSVDYIITRNKKDFINSIIEVLSPEELYFDSITDPNIS